MNTVKAVRADTLVEVAADAYVRGEDYRPRPPVMRETARRVVGGFTFKFMEPPEDYLDQLFGRCITPAEAQLYHAVTDQLTKAIKTGQLKSYAWPLYIPNTPTEADILGSSIIKIVDFKKWVHKYNPAARKDWLDLILAATEPQGEPVRIEGIVQPVQLREKATRTPKLPTRAMLDEWSAKHPYVENVGKHKACFAFAGWLKAKGYFPSIHGRTLETWFDWNNRAHRLEPNDKALLRGFETNGVESS